MTQPPELLVRGSLRKTPLAEFLVQAYDSALEGTLLLQTPKKEKSAILFIRGAPAKARPARRVVYFGEVAVEMGLISKKIALSSRARAEQEGRTHGQILREEGHIDETGLYVALREQLFRQVCILADLPETTGFGFYKANYLADWGDSGHWRVKPLPMVWRVLVNHMPESRREAWLERLADTPLKVRPEAPVSRYGLTENERKILDMLRAKSFTLQQLEQCGVGEPELVRRVACALVLSRQIELGSTKDPVGLHEPPETPNSLPPPETRAARRSINAPRAPSVPSEARTTSPRTTSIRAKISGGSRSTSPRTSTSPRSTHTRATTAGAAVDDLRREIESYQEREPRNHYEVLGVERGADAATIRSAFFRCAKLFHPDRLPAELADLRPSVTKAFAAMGEAHQTLLDEEKRAEYDRRLEDTPDDEQAQVAAVLQAASAFQRAEIFLKKKNLPAALKDAKAAYEGDPTQADYMALYAWVQGLQRHGAFDDLIEMLDKALNSSADNIRALWYRAQLNKKAGNQSKAIKDFKKIIQLKPNHVEAQRELRVFTMRRRTDPEAGGARMSGLFGVFRKKE